MTDRSCLCRTSCKKKPLDGAAEKNTYLRYFRAPKGTFVYIEIPKCASCTIKDFLVDTGMEEVTSDGVPCVTREDAISWGIAGRERTSSGVPTGREGTSDGLPTEAEGMAGGVPSGRDGTSGSVPPLSGIEHLPPSFSSHDSQKHVQHHRKPLQQHSQAQAQSSPDRVRSFAVVRHPVHRFISGYATVIARWKSRYGQKGRMLNSWLQPEDQELVQILNMEVCAHPCVCVQWCGMVGV